MLEQKVSDLQGQINNADIRITAKFVSTQNDLIGTSGRVDAMERSLPQRCHNIEQRQVGFIETMNALTAAINSKIEQIEQRVGATI